MLIKITNHFTEGGTEYFRFDMYDGPDGAEHVEGFAVDLVQAFAKLLEWRERIAADYVAEFEKDLETVRNFLQNNETQL